ncbi:motility protein A [Mariprofundus erugo]|uniref:Motility protein A n=1 Tax=Mariprofundus erugo TaxID=2528639 RepID=A0A5R9GQN4_9PROT|nr:MotA/TolQ/ExbB proton channel family protein [Mariprofundus erugo]TLS66713.1 motility protein A [Mariprofundus erugo]TLS78427.1 motility protein A [Mariprofundus erugo]
MDIATLLGIIVAFGLVIFAIGSGISSFIDPPSLMIVVGGTVGVLLVGYPLKNALGVIGVALKTFMYKVDTGADVIAKLVELAQTVRKDGILALESEVKNIDNAFMAKGLQMAIDGQEPNVIEEILYMEMDKIAERHSRGADMFTSLGTYAPSMGMIGTLVGLVLMLQNMSDPSSIGPSMSIALLTTFYGALIANILCLPMAGKLKTRSKEELLIHEIILVGIQSLVVGENPRIMEQKLLGYLPPKERKSSFE